jgi:hypothetical protein
LQDTLGIHYDDLGSYKELFELVEAKAWRVNELVTFTIHLIEVTEDVIEVLAIDILPSFSNRCHGHVQEIWTSVFRKMADSNSVDLLVGLNSRLKRNYGFALPLISMLSSWGVCIPPNGLTVPSCRIHVRIWRARVIKDRCLKKVGQCKHAPR